MQVRPAASLSRTRSLTILFPSPSLRSPLGRGEWRHKTRSICPLAWTTDQFGPRWRVTVTYCLVRQEQLVVMLLIEQVADMNVSR